MRLSKCTVLQCNFPTYLISIFWIDIKNDIKVSYILTHCIFYYKIVQKVWNYNTFIQCTNTTEDRPYLYKQA